MLLYSLLTVLLASIQVNADASTSELVGTWTSKSNTVFTGPGFYDPVDELIIEPDLPGISYSFTEDGYYEEALYRVVSNAQDHACPVGSITFQHGKYEFLANGSLVLSPFEVDGRQLLSDPCGDTTDASVYSRYYQPVLFKAWSVSLNAYHGRQYLQIYQFDGSKMQPLFLAYQPPLMLPTETLNPTSSTKKRSLKNVRRSLENQYRTNAIREVYSESFDRYWWMGVIGLGLASGVFFLK